MDVTRSNVCDLGHGFRKEAVAFCSFSPPLAEDGIVSAGAYYSTLQVRAAF